MKPSKVDFFFILVKPSKVEYFAVHSVTSTCVTLEWRHLKENRTKEFIINTASKWNDTGKVL